MTLSDLAKYTTTQSIVWPLCNIRPSCFYSWNCCCH